MRLSEIMNILKNVPGNHPVWMDRSRQTSSGCLFGHSSAEVLIIEPETCDDRWPPMRVATLRKQLQEWASNVEYDPVVDVSYYDRNERVRDVRVEDDAVFIDG
jgi:hypothetical protein